jgi:hypothetical protein
MATVSEPPWEELHGNLRAFIGRRVRNQSDVDDLVLEPRKSGELSPRTFRNFLRELSSLATRCSGPSDVGGRPRQCPQGFERRERTADDHPHADRIPPAATL